MLLVIGHSYPSLFISFIKVSGLLEGEEEEKMRSKKKQFELRRKYYLKRRINKAPKL